MDGLLIDTEAVSIEAHQAAARRWAARCVDLCHSMIGVPTRECKS